MEGIEEVVGQFLVLAVVFEVALHPLFNWDVWLKYIPNDGYYRPPVAFIIAFLVFGAYKVDIFSDLLKVMGRDVDLSFWGQVITTLLISGGSEGIRKILQQLKVRLPDSERNKRIYVLGGTLPPKVAAEVEAQMKV
jgi:hypothetical protein